MVFAWRRLLLCISCTRVASASSWSSTPPDNEGASESSDRKGGRRLVFDLRLSHRESSSSDSTSSDNDADVVREGEGPDRPSGFGVIGRRLSELSGQNRRHTHPCTLDNYDNVQYSLQIKIGESCHGGEEQWFEVVPDTGSSDLWIPANNCSHCKNGTKKFSIGRSCTARQIGDRITFRYGDGTEAVGGSFVDSVQIGDLQVENQFLIQVDKMSSNSHMKSDGILGLAHHYVSDQNSRGRTFMSTLFREHTGMARHFSFYLTGDTERPSRLVFGDADLGRYSKESEFRYGKGYYMSHTDLWLTSVWSIGWSGTGVEVSFPDRGTLGSPALIDSGSSLIVLAPDIYDHLVPELKWYFTNCHERTEQQIISCDCPPANDLSRIPWMVINVINEKDQQFSLCMSPDEYILESRDPLDGHSKCVPALQRGSSTQPVPLIFGMTFMRSFYTNFDLEHHRIGFARSNISPLPALAKCSVDPQPIVRRATWLVSVFTALVSVVFACYVLFAPKNCCIAPFSSGRNCIASSFAAPSKVHPAAEAAASDPKDNGM